MSRKIYSSKVDLEIIKNMAINEAAYFYKEPDFGLTLQSIEEVFVSIVPHNRDVLERIYRDNSYHSKAQVSGIVFRKKVSCSFVNDSCKSKKKLEETKIGYFLIIEIEGYVVIIKRNVNRDTTFLASLLKIDRKLLSEVLVESDAKFQHLQMSTLSAVSNAIRNRAYDAYDLGSSMPMMIAKDNVVNNARFKNSKEYYSVCTNTSRLGKYGAKKKLNNVIDWCEIVINKLNTSPVDNLLNRFAQPVIWENEWEKLSPEYLMINWFAVEDYLIEKNGDLHIYCQEEGEKPTVDITDHAKNTSFLHKGLNISKINGKTDSKGMLIKKECTLYNSLVLIQKESSIALRATNRLKKLCYDSDGKTKSLISLVSELGAFTVSFTDSDLIYTRGCLYRQNNFREDANIVNSILRDCADLDNVTSEKGSGYICTSTVYDNMCEFGVVENILFSSATSLLCDDLGDEWADHIAINSKEVSLSFIHSKFDKGGKDKLSATAFEEVIGQALKNIGNMNATNLELTKKKETLSREPYLKMISGYTAKTGSTKKTADWIKTNTTKVRPRPHETSGDIARFFKEYEIVKNHPNRTMNVCLVVNFLSKKNFSINIAKPTAALKQLVWLLKSFASTCQEAGMKPIIYCCS